MSPIEALAPGWLAGLAGILGMFVGSFLNVVIYRVPRGESVVAPRSRCPGCDRPIRAWENVPVLSFLALRGRRDEAIEALELVLERTSRAVSSEIARYAARPLQHLLRSSPSIEQLDKLALLAQSSIMETLRNNELHSAARKH